MFINYYTSSSQASQSEEKKQPLFFQAKLSVNQPNDEYEQEANAMADAVVRTPSNGSSFFTAKPISRLQRSGLQSEEETVSMQGNNSNGASKTEKYIDGLNSGGRPLSKDEKTFFEPRFNHDFSKVQLHTNSEANASANDINARAYTHGNHIVFGNNQYQPDTAKGKRLMAHELTHVVQQQSASNSIQRDEQKPPPDRYEELKDDKKAKEVFEKLNPATLGRYCTQNCPAVAEALEEYLKTGVFPETHCDPLGEGNYGYDIGDTEFSAGIVGWEKFWKTASANLKKHGDFLVIEAERTEKQAKDNKLTQWHYFLVLNIKEKNFIVDAFTKEVNGDLSEYTMRLIANSYRYAKGDFKIKKLRVSK